MTPEETVQQILDLQNHIKEMELRIEDLVAERDQLRKAIDDEGAVIAKAIDSLLGEL